LDDESGLHDEEIIMMKIFSIHFNLSLSLLFVLLYPIHDELYICALFMLDSLSVGKATD